MTRQDRIAWVNAHPNTPARYANAIRDGKIMKGMTKSQVKAAWGPPCGYCYGTTHSSWGDTWEYNIFGSWAAAAGSGTIVYFNSLGRVTGWSGP